MTMKNRTILPQTVEARLFSATQVSMNMVDMTTVAYRA